MPTSPTPGPTRYAFDWAPSYRRAALPFLIRPATAWVDLGPAGLEVRFGPWRLRTGIDNVAKVSRSGGFAWLKTAGPPHLSFADRGVTFATNGSAAVCLELREPVAGIDPTRIIRHPGATLTVADPDRFVEELETLRRGARL